MAPHDHGVHDACDPDVCFAAKIRYWRDNGGLSASYVGGQDFFHESCIPERQRKVIDRAAANGWEARVKNPTYDK